ncbi:MAG: YraN family protein [Thermotogae bacterium]|nr:YraN family protein [Thermotogota bacterium]
MRIRERGREGERLAEEFFRRGGYEVVARNYRKLSGEIDLVLRKGNTVYFVEVKVDNPTFRAVERIDDGKLNRMLMTAEAYLSEMGLDGYDVRFILAVVDGTGVRVVPVDENLV